jgi:hypothetical protein
MDIELLFPGRFLKEADLKGKDVTVQIESFSTEEMEDEQGKKHKGIVGFVGTKKKLLLNKTNAQAIKTMFGRETDSWIGRKITIYPSKFNDDPCIRVKGSPEIAEQMEYKITIGRRKRTYKLYPTGKGAKQAAPETEPYDGPPDDAPADVPA